MAYSQRNAAWSNVPLGDGSTIGSAGCAITGACNIAAQYGHTITPPEMVNALKAKGLPPYSWEGRFLSVIFPDIQYKGFIGYNTYAQFDAAVKLNGSLDIDSLPGIEGLLKMDSNPNVAGIQLHFSRLRGVDPSGNVVIDDSWTGNRTLVGDVYGDQRKAVWGQDVYYKAVAPAPTPAPAPAPTPPPAPAPKPYSFTKSLDCVTEVIPAGLGNFEYGNFPAKPAKVVMHDFGTKGVNTYESAINSFTKPSYEVSAHFVVSGKKITQMVSLADRAYHASTAGNDFVGIEFDPVQDADTIASGVTLLKALRDHYGYELEQIKHSSIANTACGDDIDLAKYSLVEPVPVVPTPPPAPVVEKTLWSAIMDLFNKLKAWLSSYHK